MNLCSFVWFCFVIAPNNPGALGDVDVTHVQSSELDAESKQDYPLRVLMVMKRHAEDLIWAKNFDQGMRVLRFIKRVTAEREDGRGLYKGN